MWTESLWEDHQRKVERDRLRALGELDDDDFGDHNATTGLNRDNTGAADAPPAAQEKKIKLILKARDLAPVKTTVRPSTTIDSLVAMFRASSGAPEASTVTLYFDGEPLEENLTIEDCDIEDMDTIEVSVKS